MIKDFKLFEIFDPSNIYEYSFVEKRKEHDEIGDGDTYIYKFTSKDGTNYFVRLTFFNQLHDKELWDNFLTLDYMDEEEYNQKKDVLSFDDKYKNLGKFDAIKVLNSVFNLLVEVDKKLDPWLICFDCTPDRFKVYEFCVNKYLVDFHKVMFTNEEKGKSFFYLYKEKYYYITEDGTEIKRKDNDILVY